MTEVEVSHVPPEAILIGLITLSVGAALRFSAGAEPHHLMPNSGFRRCTLACIYGLRCADRLQFES